MRRVVVVLMLIAILVTLTACKSSGTMIFEELFRYDNPVGYINSRDVESIRKGTTYAEIIRQLGLTHDVGSGLHVAHYIVDMAHNLYFSFASPDDVCPKSGVELSQSLQPIDDGSVGIRGVVKGIVHGKDGITMQVETVQHTDTALNAATVTVNMMSRVVRDQTPITSQFAFSEIKEGDTVEVTFAGPVTMSYPPMGVASVVRIITSQ